MVDVTITDLTAGGAVSGADLFETEQSGASRKIDADALFTFVEAQTFTAATLTSAAAQTARQTARRRGSETTC